MYIYIYIRIYRHIRMYIYIYKTNRTMRNVKTSIPCKEFATIAHSNGNQPCCCLLRIRVPRNAVKFTSSQSASKCQVYIEFQYDCGRSCSALSSKTNKKKSIWRNGGDRAARKLVNLMNSDSATTDWLSFNMIVNVPLVSANFKWWYNHSIWSLEGNWAGRNLVKLTSSESAGH